MILEQFLNKKAKEIDNPIRNWGVGYTAEVINEWINLQIQAKKLAIPAAEEEIKTNAQLIAAAPDLLEVLIEIDKDLCVLEGNMAQIEKSDPRADGMTTLVSEWRKRNKKAINKALGI